MRIYHTYNNTSKKVVRSAIKSNTYDDSLQPVFSAISSRSITDDMIRVKSSNIWSYKMNIPNSSAREGNLYIQFKNTQGGPGDVYVYYDVPMIIYRKFMNASSKGHFFWLYIRNVFKYHKLTGNKRGVLPNAVN